jgi:hypothetical protein
VIVYLSTVEQREKTMRLLLVITLLTISMLACNRHEMAVAVTGNGPAASADVQPADARAADHAVPFPHKPHADLIACSLCHQGAGKPVMDRTMGHQLCRDCHRKKGAGPVTCADCHQP